MSPRGVADPRRPVVNARVANVHIDGLATQRAILLQGESANSGPRNCTAMMLSATDAATFSEPETSIVDPAPRIIFPVLLEKVDEEVAEVWNQVPALKVIPELRVAPRSRGLDSHRPRSPRGRTGASLDPFPTSSPEH